MRLHLQSEGSEGSATLVDEGSALLSAEESWALLLDGGVGRVGLSMRAMPVIFPVHYAVIDRSIVFRTAPGSRIAAAAEGAVVAFSVDDYERPNTTGRSVLAVGQSELVRSSDLTSLALTTHLDPTGVRRCLVRIRPASVSGRRLLGTV